MEIWYLIKRTIVVVTSVYYRNQPNTGLLRTNVDGLCSYLLFIRKFNSCLEGNRKKMFPKTVINIYLFCTVHWKENPLDLTQLNDEEYMDVLLTYCCRIRRYIDASNPK